MPLGLHSGSRVLNSITWPAQRQIIQPYHLKLITARDRLERNSLLRPSFTHRTSRTLHAYTNLLIPGQKNCRRRMEWTFFTMVILQQGLGMNGKDNKLVSGSMTSLTSSLFRIFKRFHSTTTSTAPWKTDCDPLGNVAFFLQPPEDSLQLQIPQLALSPEGRFLPIW